MNTSSAGAIFASALPKKHFGAPEPRSSVEVPPAFPKQKVSSAFLPPPTRRVAHDVEPEPEPAQEEEEDEVGEWAQALYEYASNVRFLFTSFHFFIISEWSIDGFCVSFAWIGPGGFELDGRSAGQGSRTCV